MKKLVALIKDFEYNIVEQEIVLLVLRYYECEPLI